jgi:hypothetical protein
MIVNKINGQPDLSKLENYEISSYYLNEDGETYTVIAVHKVVALIRVQYSIDDEIAIQRQKEEKPERFQAYYNFVEQCKIKFKE